MLPTTNAMAMMITQNFVASAPRSIELTDAPSSTKIERTSCG
jgi:hypothetical protein